METLQFLLSIIRCVIYGIIIICSFVIFCPLVITLQRHNQCLLYSSLVSAGRSYTYVEFGSKSVCNYSITQAVIVCLAWALIALIVNILIFVGKLKISITDKVPALIFVVTDGICVFLTLVSACTISVGLKTLCDNFRQIFPIAPCSGISLYYNGRNDLDYYYGNLNTSAIGGWIAFTLWLVLLISSVAGILLNRKHNSRRQRQTAQTLQVN